MKYLLLSVILITTINLIGQPDTIVAYDVYNQTIEIIPPILFDNTLTFENTSSSTGLMGGKVPLDLEPPTSNLVENTSFTDIARAELFFNVSSYPARTVVKLFAWNNDTLSHLCTGIMVSENLVLTVASSIFSNNSWRHDSILAAPAYDNGMFHIDLPTSTFEKYYIFKKYYEGVGGDNIALLKLKHPIGTEIGWIGIAYNKDTTYFYENVFHKLSYPQETSPVDETRVYNGDTLYYNYGLIDLYWNNFIGVTNGYSMAILGKEGSSIFYTNNFDYYSFGVLNWAAGYKHYLINQNVFNQFKNIIENHAASIVDKKDDESLQLVIYPNPADEHLTIEFFNPDNKPFSLTVYDLQGRKLRHILIT
jgi:hypothetical protein